MSGVRGAEFRLGRPNS